MRWSRQAEPSSELLLRPVAVAVAPSGMQLRPVAVKQGHLVRPKRMPLQVKLRMPLQLLLRGPLQMQRWMPLQMLSHPMVE